MIWQSRMTEINSLKESEDFLIQMIQGRNDTNKVPLWKESVEKDKEDYNLDAFLKRFEEKETNENRNSKDYALIVGNQALLVQMGMYHAIATEKKACIVQPENVLLTCKDLLEQRIDSITLLGLYQNISYEMIFSIQKLLLSKNFEVSFGLMVAENEFDLGYRLSKSTIVNQFPKKQDVLALTLMNDSYEDYGDVTVFTAANLTYATLSAVLKEGVRSFNIISHGRDDSIVVADALLCGKYSDDLTTSTAGRVPQCAHNQKCFRPDVHLIKVRDLEAQVVFLNSCLPFKLKEGNFKQDYLLTHSLLRGKSTALIASPFIKEAKLYENILFQHLLASGQSLGEITKILNKTLFYNNVDIPQLFLHGDPKLSYKNNLSLPLKVEWDGKGRLDINGQGQRYITIELPDASFSESVKNNSLSLDFKLKKNKAVYYNIIGCQDKSIIYVYSLASIEEFSVTFTSVVKIEEQILKRLKALQSLTNLNINIPKLNSTINEILSTLKHISRLIGPATFEISAAQKLKQSRKKVQELLNKCDHMLIENILEDIEKKVVHFSDTYRDGTITQYKYDQYQECPYCDQQCLILPIQHKIYENIDRHILMCPVCGVISDIPVQPIEIIIDAPNEFQKLQPTTVHVNIENQGVESFDGYLGLRIIDAKRHGVLTSPEIIQINLNPRSRLTCSFEVTIGKDATQHQHWLSGFAILNSEVYNARKNIWVK